MKSPKLLTVVSALILSTAVALADSYTITLQPGFNAVVNQLDNGSGNSAANIFSNPGGALDGCELRLWNCNAYTVYVFDSSSPTGFTDQIGNGVAAPILTPGTGFLFNNLTGAPIPQTFSGTPVTPTVPTPLPCGCGQPNLLGRQTPGIGLYENITGLTPVEGALVRKFLITQNGTVIGFDDYTFTGCAWTPAVPTANVGESVFVTVPCSGSNTCPCQPAPLALFNTGVNGSGATLGNGAFDPHYVLTSNPNGGSPNAVVINSQSIPGAWVSNSAISRWIGPLTNAGGMTNATFVYQVTFDVPCLTNAVITGRWAADNDGAIVLNGTTPAVATLSGGVAGNFSTWHPFAISSGLVAGQNTLTFYVTNATGATGLRVELSGTATCCDSNCCAFCTEPYPIRYTNNLYSGANFVVDSLCHGTNNTVNDILTNLPSSFTTLSLWNFASQSFDPPLTYYDENDAFPDPAGWYDNSGNRSTAVLQPGEGFVINNGSGFFQYVVQGCNPTCPPPCLPPTNGMSLVGRFGIGTATWTNIFSCPPPCGARVSIFNGSSFVNYDFVNNAWTPPPGPLLAIGQSAFVSLLANTNCTSTNCCDTCTTNNYVSYTIHIVANSNYFLANPLCHGTNNDLATLIPNPPPGTIVLIYHGGYSSYVFDDIDLVWTGDPNINPGDGFVLNSPTDFDLTFYGCDPTCPPPCLPPANGQVLVGRRGIGTATWSDLSSCDPACGTRVSIYNGGDLFNGFDNYDYVNGGWQPPLPLLDIAQSVFVSLPFNTNCITNGCITMTCTSNKTVNCPWNGLFNEPTNIVDSCCTNFTISFTTATNSGPCPLVVTRIWTISDLCGNTNTCSQTVTVVDTTPPVFTNCPASTNLGCNPVSIPTCSGTVHAIDNCSAVTVTCFQVTVTNGCNRTRTITYTARDACGNSNNCTQVITWTVDTTPPALACFTNKTVSCGSAIQFDTPTATDNCSGTNVTLTYTDTTNGFCPLIITRAWVATDLCGKTNTCNQSITVLPLLPCIPPPPGLALWLPFDETSGPVSANLYQGGNNGAQINGPAFNGGYVGNSLCFDGVNDYVDVAPYPAINIGTGDFSVDAWIKPATLDNTLRVIVDHRDENAVIGYSFFLGGNNTLGFQIADGPFINYASTASVPADGLWHLVAVTVKRNDPQGIHFLLDGVVVGPGRDPTGYPGSITPPSNIPFRVGSRASSVSALFSGCIDEVEVFTRELGTNEIAAIYNAGAIGKCKAPKLSCSINKTISCTSAVVFDPPTVNDPCCTNQAVMVYRVDTNGTSCARTMTTTWLYVDCCGASNFCAQTITLINTNPPVITPTATNIVVNTCSNSALVFFSASATSACCTSAPTIIALGYGGSTGSTTVGGTLGLGTTIVTWRATDCCGNISTTNITVIVTNFPPPTITIDPTNSSINLCCSNGCVVLGDYRSFATASGPITQFPPPGTTVCATTNVLFICTNNCGVTNIASIIVHLVGGLKFTFLPAGGDLGCNPTNPPTDATVLAQVGTFGCSGVISNNVTHVDVQTNCTIYRTFSITVGSVCGPISTNVQYSWLKNTNPPVITPAFSNLVVTTCSNSALVFISASATSLCCTDAPLIIAFGWGASHGSLNVGRPLGLGTTTVTWQATDCCGNISTTNVTVTVKQTPTPQSWTTEGSMATGRWAAGAEVLPSGRVLVTCGITSAGSFTSGAEAYDPTTGQWSGIPGLPAQHRRMSVRLLDNKILVAGDDPTSTYTAYLYDEGLNTWTAAGNPSFQHIGASLTRLNSGRVMLAAGYCGGLCATYNTVEIFQEPSTWTTTNPMAETRTGHATTVLPNGKVLVTGGAQRNPIVIRGTCELYDENTGLWSSAQPMNVLREGHTATLLPNGKVLVVGGATGPNDFAHYTATAEIYDPGANTWTLVASMATARVNHTATLLPCGQVLVVGGLNDNGTAGTCEVYDPVSNSWSTTATLATARYSHTATLLGSGQVLVAGGTDSGGSFLASSELYSPDCCCDSNKTVNCSASWSFTQPVLASWVTGFNTNPVVLSTTTNGSCPQVITRTWAFTNACNQTNLCSQTVTVVNTNLPVITPAFSHLVVNTCSNTALVFISASATSLCCTDAPLIIAFGWGASHGSLNVGRTLGLGITTVTWQATDCCGNISTTNVTITVTNTALATLTCTNKTVACGTSWHFDPPGAVDTCCSNVTFQLVSSNLVAGPCPVWQGLWQAVDCYSNIAFCAQLVTVTSLPPVVICPPDRTNACTAKLTFTKPTVTSPCCGQNYTASPNGPIVTNHPAPCRVTYTANWLVTDCCGKTNTCSQTITLTNVPPILTGVKSNNIPCGGTNKWSTPIVVDPCCTTNRNIGILRTFTNSFNPLIVVRTWVATNCCGLTNTFSQTNYFLTAPPPNDLCPNAIDVAVNSSTCGTTICATPSTDMHNLPYNSANSPDVWYKFTPACGGTVRIDTCGSNCPAKVPIHTFNTVLSVYTGQCGSLKELSHNDNAPGKACGVQSLLPTLTVNAGITYYVRVAGNGNVSGQFVLNITQLTTTTPANDHCATATVVGNGTYAFNLCTANTDPNPPCGMSHDIWFKYTPTCSGTVWVDTCNSSFDTILAVYSGNCSALNLIHCTDTGEVGPCAGGIYGSMQFTATANTPYYIRIGSHGLFNVSGKVTIQGPFPAMPTCPPISGPSYTRAFKILGPGNGTTWAWSISIPCCMNVGANVSPGLNGTAAQLATYFANSINSVCAAGIIAVAHNDILSVSVTSCTGSGTPFIFRVGPFGSLEQNQCVVANVPLPGYDPLPTSGLCSFNPETLELELSGHDYNNNGVDDAIDILEGTSQDVNGNGIPDEVESCIAPELVTYPESQIVSAGSTITLSASASGTLPQIYQWSLNGNALSDNGNVSGSSSNVLTILAVGQADLGDYTVTVNNTCGGDTSVPATLAYFAVAPPVIVNPVVGDGTFQFTFLTQDGVSYVVEYTDDLQAPEWTALEIVEGDGNPRDALDVAPQSAARFYRVRSTGP